MEQPSDSPPGYTQALALDASLDPALSAELRGFSVVEYNAEAEQDSSSGHPHSTSTSTPEPGGAVSEEAAGAQQEQWQQLRNECCRTSICRGRCICIAVGEDCCTDKTLKYAAKYICKPQDCVTLVHISCNGSSTGGGSLSSRAVGSLGSPQQPAGDGARQAGGGAPCGGCAKNSGGETASQEESLLLKARDTLLRTGKVQAEQLSLVVLPASKQVGHSLVAHCRQCHYDILVCGSKGVSGMKVRLLSLMGGEGSVSKFCREHLKHTTVVVVRPPSEHSWDKS